MPRTVCLSAIRHILLFFTLCSSSLVLADDEMSFAGDNFVDAFADSDIPIILTAARLRQPQSEVPASVTIIDREMINMLGAREIPELLRLVPGMAVANVDGNIPSVSYHATVSQSVKRMQVLVDGRSVYQPGAARVWWDNIPLTVDDIDRIEVTRGPNAAAYGPNAFSGVINIITLHTNDTLGAKARYTGGNNGTNDIYLRAGAEIGAVSYRISAYGREDNGYNRYEDGSPRRDGKDIHGITFKSTAQLDTDNSIELHMGYSSENLQEDPIDGWDVFGSTNTNPDQTTESQYLMGKWRTAFSEKHSLSVQVYQQKSYLDNNWNTCMVSQSAGLETNLLFTTEAYALRELYRTVMNDTDSMNAAGYFSAEVELRVEAKIASLPPGSSAATILSAIEADLGGSLYPQQTALIARAIDIALANNGTVPLLCGEVDTELKEGRLDFEVVDNLTINEQLRLVSGLAYRRETADSRFYLNGKVSNESYSAFAHMEYHPFNKVLVNIGSHYEKGDTSGSTFSPRVALILHFNPNHTVRLVRSRATRSIDIYESAASNRLYLKGINAPYQNNTESLLGQPEALFYVRNDMDVALDNETIDAIELGYYGYIADQLEMDIRLFDEELDKLISEGVNLATFKPSNNNSVHMQGAETQLKWRAGDRDLLLLTAAYLDNDASIKIENRLTAKYSGAFMWNHKFNNDINGNLAYFRADKYNEDGSLGGLLFERADLGLSKTFKFNNNSQLKLSGKYMRHLNDNPIVTGDNNYPSQNSYFFTAEIQI